MVEPMFHITDKGNPNKVYYGLYKNEKGNIIVSSNPLVFSFHPDTSSEFLAEFIRNRIEHNVQGNPSLEINSTIGVTFSHVSSVNLAFVFTLLKQLDSVREYT
jgi:hypothetical protein